MLDTYRDPKTEKLYGLPPDSNYQMTYYWADVFDKLGIKVPKAWEKTIEATKDLTGGGHYGFTWSFRRNLYSLYATSFKRISE